MWRLSLLALACASRSVAAPAPPAAPPTPAPGRPTAPAVAAPAPERVWLVIMASNPSAQGIGQSAKAVSRTLPPHLVIQTRDCGAHDNVFALAALAGSADAASALLSRVKPSVADAYVKRCDVVPRSLLALRTSVIDASIYDVPEAAVNWDEAARISASIPLSDGRTLIVQRYFVNDPEDPLEGRRERVLLPQGSTWQPLQDDCPSAGSFSARAGRIAFQCAREQAGDALLHDVVVVAPDGRALATVPHCRAPRWLSADRIACDAETVGADGQLVLRAKPIDLSRAEAAVTQPERR